MSAEHSAEKGTRIGALFAGYGGLDMAVQQAVGGDLAWYSDICRVPTKENPATHHGEHRGPCRLFAHRFPGVPNHGDVTAIDWSTVEPVDVLTGGSPCQDLSHAGKRQGMTDGTRSNLWVAMREAIAYLQPSLVVWENVRGAYSAAADSAMEQCARCVGDPRYSGPVLRALGRVLGDLADLGYDASWYGLPASDVGAPHGRFRVFVAAYPQRLGCDRWARAARRRAVGGVAAHGGVEGALLPTPRSSDGDKGLRTTAGAVAEFERKGTGADLATVLKLLPTPAVNDMGEGKTVTAWDEWTAKMKAAHGNGNGHGASLAIELQRIESGWGPYAPAVERWEHVLGRPAPLPSEPVRVREWMMGLPDGWVTDVPGMTRREALKLLGNGVVPQQGAAALRSAFLSEVAA